MHQLFFPNGFEKTKVRWEKIKIKLAHNVFGLGEVAFVRWLVCRKAILPNPCYMKCRLIYDKAQLEH
jgi:hypothetical protein